MNKMSEYIEKKISFGSILNAIVLISGIIIFLVTVQKDVENVRHDINDVKEFHQLELPAIYMRQDVFDVQIERLQNDIGYVRDATDRIEKKLQKENGN